MMMKVDLISLRSICRISIFHRQSPRMFSTMVALSVFVFVCFCFLCLCGMFEWGVWNIPNGVWMTC